MMRRILCTLCLATLIGCGDADKQPPAAEPGYLNEEFRADTPPGADARLFSLGQWTRGGIQTLPEVHAAFVKEFIRVANVFGGERMIYIGPSTSSQWVEYIPESAGGVGDAVGDPQSRKNASFDPATGTLNLADGSQIAVNEQRWNPVEKRLIGLLGDSPAVYLHDLPGMHKRMSNPGADGKTRPSRGADAFETQALARLKDGVDVVASAGREDMRMVGAIRAGADCLGCHKAQQGDLLGAFTYTLRAAPPASDPAVP